VKVQFAATIAPLEKAIDDVAKEADVAEKKKRLPPHELEQRIEQNVRLPTTAWLKGPEAFHYSVEFL
jgi:hypothetical protein